MIEHPKVGELREWANEHLYALSLSWGLLSPLSFLVSSWALDALGARVWGMWMEIHIAYSWAIVAGVTAITYAFWVIWTRHLLRGEMKRDIEALGIQIALRESELKDLGVGAFPSKELPVSGWRKYCSRRLVTLAEKAKELRSRRDELKSLLNTLDSDQQRHSG